jgi:hypothetical protein
MREKVLFVNVMSRDSENMLLEVHSENNVKFQIQCANFPHDLSHSV